MQQWLKGIEEIKRFFAHNTRPIFFISPTNYNLMGIDSQISNFRFVTYHDCYQKRHPNIFTPDHANSPFINPNSPRFDHREIVDINNYLLELPEVIRYLHSFGPNPVALFLMYDEKTEALCAQNGIEIWFPSSELRNRLDDKLETVRLGNRAGVSSAPNCLSKVENYWDLQRIALQHGLGTDLVLQTAYGDSGHTTFFVSSEADWNQICRQITSQAEVKIMKRLNCLSATQEGCITRAGIAIAPLQAELIGQPELTVDRGGWCGNELSYRAFSSSIQERAHEKTRKIGEELFRTGYRGYFDIDYLIDRENQAVYLGELNPRISGATPLTTNAALANADIPLFLLHLLEFFDIPFDLDMEALNREGTQHNAEECWSSLIIKHRDSAIKQIRTAPRGGIWTMKAGGTVEYDRFACHCQSLCSNQEAFVQQAAAPGKYRFPGEDIARVVLREPVLTNEFLLTARAKDWVSGLRAHFSGVGDK